jgi:hypothetical protein
LQVHACKAVHPNCKLLALISTRPVGLGTWGPIIAAPYLHFTQIQSKSTMRKKNMGKNTVSVMQSILLFLILLRCFIDFQTSLADSRNLVIFSTFW